MLIDLSKTTLIIPLRVEHQDRERNAKAVLGFLNSKVNTNVFIFEISDSGKTTLPFLGELKNLNIKHWISSPESAFHRTKYLNIMLDDVETPVVVNYDIDVILDPINMEECQDKILRKEAEVIYPYELGWGQIQVLESFDYEVFTSIGYNLEFINESTHIKKHQSECGHCIFFDTEVYRLNGGENEDFISYGPEDKERVHRFQTLGKKVEWRPGKFVYHFEHFRGNDSWMTNPFFSKNWEKFSHLKSLDQIGLREYYRSPEYSLKYQKICK